MDSSVGKHSPRMLVFSALEIENGRSIHVSRGEPGTENHYPVSALDVASMLRNENAKALHVVDRDGMYGRARLPHSMLHEIAEKIQIPIQYCGGMRSYGDVAAALSEFCVSRVVLGALSIFDTVLLARLIGEFGPSRIVVALDVAADTLLFHDRNISEQVKPAEHIAVMQSFGVERFVYTDTVARKNNTGPPLTALRKLCCGTNLKLTLNGSIRNYADLAEVSKLQSVGVDSIILDDALCDNVFPCQKLWRIAEQNLILKNQPFY